MKISSKSIHTVFVISLVCLGFGYWFFKSDNDTNKDTKNANSGMNKKAQRSENHTPEMSSIPTIPLDLQSGKNENPANMTAAKPSSLKGSTSNFIITARKTALQNKLIAMKSRLKLNSEQENQIDSILKNQSEYISKYLEGEIEASDLKNPPNFEQQILGLLNSDQVDEFQKMQKEEKNSGVEMSANTQMNQIASSLNLNEDQKDQVYAALVQAQQAIMDPDTIKQMIANGWKPEDIAIEIKREWLSKILTKEQMEIYNKQLETEHNMIREIYNKQPK